MENNIILRKFSGKREDFSWGAKHPLYEIVYGDSTICSYDGSDLIRGCCIISETYFPKKLNVDNQLTSTDFSSEDERGLVNFLVRVLIDSHNEFAEIYEQMRDISIFSEKTKPQKV